MKFFSLGIHQSTQEQVLTDMKTSTVSSSLFMFQLFTGRDFVALLYSCDNDHLSRLRTSEIRLLLSGTFALKRTSEIRLLLSGTFELKDSVFITIQLEGCFGSRCVRKVFKNHFFRKETKPIIAIEGGQFFVDKFTPFIIDDSFCFG